MALKELSAIASLLVKIVRDMYIDDIQNQVIQDFSSLGG